MTHSKPFRISERLKSFKFAFQGIYSFFRTEHNARIHLASAIAVIILGFYLRINSFEWCWISVAITLVFITELLNSAIEALCNVVSPQFNIDIKKTKDISAGAVLVASFFAMAVGLIIFLPKLL